MIDLGPERAHDQSLREWFDDQRKRNLDRLEEGAKTITQLVTGLYGVLFAVLALNDQPEYLQRASVRWLGILGVATFFAALLAALITLYPWATSYQEDNLSQMKRAYDAMLRRKSWSLRIALWSFLAGTGFLAGVIVAVLWNF